MRWMMVLALAVGCKNGDEGEGFDFSSIPDENQNGDEGEGFDFSSIPDENLSGTVGGASWTFVSGTTDSFLSDADGFFALFDESATDCASYGASQGNSLISSLPAEPGEYEMGLSQTLTFYVSSTSENLIATTGGIRIDEVTANEVSGGLYAEYDEANQVAGTFVITICED